MLLFFLHRLKVKNAIQNVHGSATIQDAMLSAHQFANHQNVIQVALSQKLRFVTLNAKGKLLIYLFRFYKYSQNLFLFSNFKDQTASQCAQTKLVKWWIAQNAWISVIHLIVLLIAKCQSQNVKQFALNQFVTGNVQSHFVPNQNVNLFAKIQLADLK